MRVNADFTQIATLVPAQYNWVASPQSGVERVMLDRVGEEKARATSFVRYAPDSYFPPHSHPGGEEILVLDGVFSEADEHYSAVTYMRSPPGSSHQPYSAPGALIFVKLCQMLPSNQAWVRMSVDLEQPAQSQTDAPWEGYGDRDVCLLYQDDLEAVSLQRLAGDAQLFDKSVPGAELVVLAGALSDGETTYPAGSWLRLPKGLHEQFVTCAEGVIYYQKIGQLGVTSPGILDVD